MTERSGRLASYLSHIAQAIDRITNYLDHVPADAFASNTLLQDAVIRNLEIVGEASRNILKHHPEFVGKHPELPLQSAYEMRNILAHGYFEVDLAIVWDTTRRDLPALLIDVRKALGELSEGQD